MGIFPTIRLECPGLLSHTGDTSYFAPPSRDPHMVDRTATVTAPTDEPLTASARAFLADLERRFRTRRADLLVARQEQLARFRQGERPHFLDHTAAVRGGAWQIAPPPPDLLDRRVELVGSVDRATVVASLSSGANVFMADFEDATSPTWSNIIGGHAAVRDALHGLLPVTDRATPSTMVVRPRGWHLDESRVLVDDAPMSASVFDFGMVMFHSARTLLDNGSGPYFSLPKLENHFEARLWNDVFCHSQDALGIPRGSVKATVIVETITAAFEMDEILYELREHGAGLGAGRWDYLASIIRCLGHERSFVLPDRADLGGATPFMASFTDLLVATSHRRGAHAIGPVTTFVPDADERDATAELLAAVAQTKRLEALQGYDGTRVAHPDLVGTAQQMFDDVLGDRAHQIDHRRPDVEVDGACLLPDGTGGGAITEEGLRTNISFALRYLVAWLSGRGTLVHDGRSEGAATAEISRAQVWQWVHHGCVTSDGAPIDAERVRDLADAELTRIEDEGAASAAGGCHAEARRLFEQVTLREPYVDFFTGPAQLRLDRVATIPPTRAA